MMWGLGKGIRGIEYIISKQAGSGYSLMNIEIIKANSKEGTWKKYMEAWVGGGGGCLKIVFDDKGH